MATLSISTRDLVGLLTDALGTTRKDVEVTLMNSVLLHTDRGPWQIALPQDDPEPGDDPLFDEIDSDLFVATSYDGSAVSQGHTQCTGTLRVPALVSVASAKAIVAVFKPLITGSRLGKSITHRCTVEIAPGSVTLDVCEDQDLVPEGGAAISVPLVDSENYPRDVVGMLTPDPGLPVEGDPPSYGTGIDRDHLAVIGAVAKRRKMNVAWYRHHQNRRIVVTVGRAWRMVFLPVDLDTQSDTGQYEAPQVPAYQPPLPPRHSDHQPVQEELAGV